MSKAARGLLPRHIWLIQRVEVCLYELGKFHTQSELNWDHYMIKAKELAEELLYTCNEWEKYYKDMEEHKKLSE